MFVARLRELLQWLDETQGARLSSARVVRCWVKSRNERNPTFSYHLRALKELPVISWRKVGMTSSPHGPYVLNNTCYMVLQWDAKRRLLANPKMYLSSDCTLCPRVHEVELLVIADHAPR